MQTYLDLYLARLENLNRSAATIAQYGKELKAFSTYLQQQQRILSWSEVEPLHFDLYQHVLIQKGNSANTRAKKASILKNFFSFLHTRSYLKTNPTDTMEPIKVKDVDQKKREILSVEESVKLIERMTKHSIPSQKLRNRCILYVFLFGGLRVSELVYLTFEDIDFKEKTIYIKGKGGKVREVPLLDGGMTDDLKALYRTRKKDQRYVFTAKNSLKPISPRGMHDLIKRHVEKANIQKNIGCHSLRRTAASNLLASGVNLRHIQLYLGHSDISTTMRYLNPDKEEVKRSIRENNVLSKKLQKKRSSRKKS